MNLFDLYKCFVFMSVCALYAYFGLTDARRGYQILLISLMGARAWIWFFAKHQVLFTSKLPLLLIRHIYNVISSAVIKRHNKEQLWEERVYLA